MKPVQLPNQPNASIRYLLIALCLFAFHQNTYAQSKKNPSEYMAFIGAKYNALSVQFYQYMSAIAHSNNARKIEKQRAELLTLSWNTYTDVRTMPIFQGNRELRDSAAAYLKINHRILKEDYDKILDMELIAERSYNDMEAYINAQREARNKLDVANIRMLAEQKKFAARYNINLVERTDEIYRRMQDANDVLSYLNKVHLTFFKSHKDEIYLLESMRARNKKEINTSRLKLLASSKSGISYLGDLGLFQNDASLRNSCRNLLEFYQREASQEILDMVNYIHAEQDFERSKIFFESLSEEEKTAENVDLYNNAVRKMNTAADGYNASNQKLNQERSELLQNWRESYDRFLARHVPKF